MVGVLASSVVDRGFICGVMVGVLAASVVYRGFIGGVMVGVLAASVVDREVHRWCNGWRARLECGRS
jgi:fructose-specific phosphotransferase system IIC component